VSAEEFPRKISRTPWLKKGFAPMRFVTLLAIALVIAGCDSSADIGQQASTSSPAPKPQAAAQRSNDSSTPASSTADDSAKADAAHAAAVADCQTKHLATTALWTNPDSQDGAYDRYSAQGQALLALAANGNVTVEDLFYKYDKGERYCMAKVHIEGDYQGNSYSADGYMFAF